MPKDLLEGVRVLDFTLAAVGPFCSRVLSDLGAEVIHVEWPRGLGAAAQIDSDGRFTREKIRDNTAMLFLWANGGKRSLSVNLKDPRGVQIIWDMIPSTDVVLENMTPRVMESLGLSYTTLSDLNPALVMCSLTGFGQQGLEGDRGRPSTDPTAQAMSGLSWITGERHGPPYAIGGGLGDTITSMTGAAAILAALFGRQESGKGQHIDLSMVEACAFLDCTVLPYVAANDGDNDRFFRNGQQNSYTFPMGPFQATGGYISIQASGAGSESPWGRLCELMGREDLLDDDRLLDDRRRLEHTDEVVGIVEHWLCSFENRAAPLALLAEARISAGPVLSQEEMLEHPFFEEPRTFGGVDYPELGEVKVVEPPFKFSDARAFVRGTAPEWGEHNRDILSSNLGMTDDQIDELIRDGVLFESEGAKRRLHKLAQAAAPVGQQRD